jgi:hypothetical protein
VSPGGDASRRCRSSDMTRLRGLVGSPEDDERDQYVSLAVAFSWVDTALDRPLGDREFIRDDPNRRPSRSQSTRDEVGREGSIELIESDPDTNRADWSVWRPHLI